MLDAEDEFMIFVESGDIINFADSRRSLEKLINVLPQIQAALIGFRLGTTEVASCDSSEESDPE